ncbi:MAG: VOC family protein, partial [Campylobacterales bacterium]|nr:VOC family protein [Campylobacterales bacterium]
YWEKLSADPDSEVCGWCKDKYGVSWQIAGENMQELLKKDNRVIVVIGTKELMGLHGMGMGVKIIGNALISSDTKEYKDLKAKFEWARAVMKIEILESYQTT